MDVLRAVLGDKKLNYVGASYGTFLGATYAGLFPAARPAGSSSTARWTRRCPRSSSTATRPAASRRRSSRSPQDCVEQPDCPLGTKSADERRPQPQAPSSRSSTPSPSRPARTRKLDESLATTGVIAAMYDESSWPQLRDALAAAKKGDGAHLLALADSYYERDADGHYAQPHVRQRRRQLPRPPAGLRLPGRR